MSPVRDGSRGGSSETERSEVHLSRYSEDRWTLSDGEGVIMAPVEVFAPVER